MIKYVLKRLLMMIPVMLGVLTIAFILNELTPGDAATALAGSEATEEQVEAIREELGLNGLLQIFARAHIGDTGALQSAYYIYYTAERTEQDGPQRDHRPDRGHPGRCG